MRRLILTLASAALLGLLPATPASAAFGFKNLDVRITGPDGTVEMQAGSHPFAMSTSLEVNTIKGIGLEGVEEDLVDGALKDLEVELPPGMAGSPDAVPRCSTVDFLDEEEEPTSKLFVPACSDSTAIGFVKVNAVKNASGDANSIAVYNLDPPPGVAAKIGFWFKPVPITIEVGVSPEPPHQVVAKLRNAAQVVEVFSAELTIWGNPGDPAHDDLRGMCSIGSGTCPANIPVRPFLTLPRSCAGPLATTFRATPWWEGDRLNPSPGTLFEQTVFTNDGFVPPSPIGTSGCEKLAFAPRLEAQPTTDQASSPSGLGVSLTVEDEGLTNPSGLAHSDIRDTIVTLPEDLTLNPSIAEGLLTCSPDQLRLETPDSAPGQGCPQASKVGTLEVETPVLENEVFEGDVFVATQDDPATTTPGAENPFDSLVAFYLVIRDPELGILVKQAGRVEPHPVTGQLVSVFEDLPQFPLSQVRLQLRSGARSPLISPGRCGTYTTKAEFIPWADPSKVLVATSDFEITRGIGGGSCPPAGPPPFHPGFQAGAINNQAGAHSPFYMRLTRRDGDQDLTRFAASLPPGVTAKLAGTTQCSDAAIAAAMARRGRQELASPSCPQSSYVGRVVGGAGVGSQLTYVPGRVYLAGPVGTAPLSVVAIVPAVAGPFDVGTVVLRQALQLNPRTGEVRVDGSSSDPLPHMLAGIPLKVRDVHVHVDRPNFTLNPTDCDPFAIGAQLWGGGADPLTSADDAPFSASARFQAAGCARLGFKPTLSLRLKGGTKRGDFPALRTVYRPRPGDANLSDLVLRLPRSAFLEQGHFRTICTRVQFAADACPKGAIYGRARAFTPILDQPLEGPLYLRSSNHNLPDLVFDLHGLVDIEAVARVDSHKGGIRATVEDVPDAPISKVVVTMQGGKKGLIVNSRNLCATPSRATIELTAQNNKQRNLKPLVRAQGCKKASKRKGKRR